MPMHSMEHQHDQGEALFANMERGVGIFFQNCHSFLPIRQILIRQPILQDGRHTIINMFITTPCVSLLYIFTHASV